MDVLDIKKIASMDRKEKLNIFEMEKMFDDAMKSIQWKAPSKEQCVEYHVKHLHSQLLLPVENAMLLVKEIYDCTIKHDLLEEQMNWQEISDTIDDFQYGDNQQGYKEEKINEMIITHALRLWHTKISKIDFRKFIGQKITAVDSEVHFIIQLEKGAIIIECPWRIRDTGGILLGETDIQSNQSEWKSIKELLIGKKIEDIQLLEQCPLLIVQCDNIFLRCVSCQFFFRWLDFNRRRRLLYVFHARWKHCIS